MLVLYLSLFLFEAACVHYSPEQLFFWENNYSSRNYSCAARLASIILLSELFFWENNKIDPKWLKNPQIILPGDAVLSKNNISPKNYSPEQLLF